MLYRNYVAKLHDCQQRPRLIHYFDAVGEIQAAVLYTFCCHYAGFIAGVGDGGIQIGKDLAFFIVSIDMVSKVEIKPH